MEIQKSSSLKSDFSFTEIKVAIVWSRFNESITRSLLQGAIDAFKQENISEESIEMIEVPGAFEIPLAAKAVAEEKKCDGVVCLGTVIRGDTPHFDYVCLAVTQGILQAELQTNVPMAFGILTTNTIEQALARSAPDETNKGFEAAKVLLEMITLMRKLKKHGKST